jgi:hypothetical protein
MILLKSGDDLYWNGTEFQPDHRKAILFGAMTRATRHLRRAKKVDPNCKLEVLTEYQWIELASRGGS